LVNEPSARDSGLRRVSRVTKWVAAVGAALMAAFAVHAASANPGRSSTTNGVNETATDDDSGTPSFSPGVPGLGPQEAPRRHTTTGGS
jgi:hypothetical protein